MRNFFIVLSFSIIIISFFFCSKNDSNSVEFIVPADYKSWKQPANKILSYSVPGHGKSFRRIYANDKAFQVRISNNDSEKKYIFPDGTIFIKETFQKEEDVDNKNPGLTIMIKDSLNEKGTDGWIYLMKEPDKENPVQIESKLCTGCHTAANDTHPYFDGNQAENFRDYIFVPVTEINN